MSNDIPTKDMSMKEWLSYRPHSMGASDAGAILSLNPWKSPVDVWLEKTGQADPVADNWNMKIGRDMEPLIRKYIEDQEGLKIRKDNFIRVDKKDPIFTTNLDGMVIGEKVPVEIKTTSIAWDGEIKDFYFAQIQHQLMVMNKLYLYFAVLNLGFNKSLTVQKFERNDEFIKSMREEMKKFWVENVIAKIPPLARTPEEAAKAFPREVPGKVYKANEKVREALIEIKQIKSLIKDAEDKLAENKLTVMNSMEDAEQILDTGEGVQLEGEDGLILATWKKNKDGEKFDKDQFKRNHPRMYNKYVSVKTGARVFLIK